MKIFTKLFLCTYYGIDVPTELFDFEKNTILLKRRYI